MNISLSPNLEKAITQKVSAGLYASADEVIRTALQFMEEQDQSRATDLGYLRQDVLEGLDSGEPTAWDPHELKTAGKQRVGGWRRGEVENSRIIVQFPRISADLAEIRRGMANGSAHGAYAFVSLLDRKVHAIAQQPDMGPAREELARGLRSLPVNGYIVFYRVRPKGLDLVRLLPESRDPGPVHAGTIIEIGSLKIDPQKCEVTVEGVEIGLTATEFRILHLLASQRGIVFSRHRILAGIWGGVAVRDRTIDVHIMHLKEKMGKAGALVKNVRGFGFKFEV
jgi:putative addiction module CopG family antidote